MNNKLKGYFCSIVAAICYGTNPLGALFLYKEGLNAQSIIFYRYSFAILILYLIMVCQKVNLRINMVELKVLAVLGFMFSLSSLSLYSSFLYLDSGIASTILFAYPIMVAIIMALLYKEKISFFTIFSIVLSTLGIILLYNGGPVRLNTWGVALVLFSSLTYAIYIVIVNRSKITMSSFKMTFYIMLFALLTTSIYCIVVPAANLVKIPSLQSVFWIILLAIIPTVVAMVMLNIGIFHIGSTPSAILGALEPVTAVIISLTVFGGVFSTKLCFGIILILIAVCLIVVGKKLNSLLIHKK